MGTFDSMHGYAKCPRCDSFARAGIDFKWGDSSMSSYGVGTILGNETLALGTVGRDWAHCGRCQERFRIVAVAKWGAFAGFCNAKQWLRVRRAEKKTLGNARAITLNIAEGMDEPEQIAEALLKALRENPNGKQFALSERGTLDIDEWVCAVSHRVEDPLNRPQAGQTCWFDPRRRVEDGSWEEADTKYRIVSVREDRELGILLCELEAESGERKTDAPEYRLVMDAEEREKRISKLLELEESVAAYANGKKDSKQAAWFRVMNGFGKRNWIVEKLKSEGRIPADFEL